MPAAELAAITAAEANDAGERLDIAFRQALFAFLRVLERERRAGSSMVAPRTRAGCCRPPGQLLMWLRSAHRAEALPADLGTAIFKLRAQSARLGAHIPDAEAAALPQQLHRVST